MQSFSWLDAFWGIVSLIERKNKRNKFTAMWAKNNNLDRPYLNYVQFHKQTLEARTDLFALMDSDLPELLV